MELQAAQLRIPPDADGATPLCGKVDLTIRPSERILVEGPSGSGKTTLLRCLALLEARMLGEIRWNGTAIAANAASRYRTNVVYVPQTAPRYAMTVEESLRHAFGFCSQAGHWQQEHALALCDKLMLPTRILERDLRDLSGGEAQRINLIRSLIISPKVLLVDEPTSALDPDTRLAMVTMLDDWVGQERALVVISHDTEHFCDIATRRIRIENGSIVQPIASQQS